MKLGLMGGTFNPIHMGHLIISEYIRTSFPLDKIIFIPTGNPPHKNNKDIIAAEHRLTMTKLATMGNVYFEVSKMEIDRIGNSYTIDSIKEIRTKYSDCELYFMIGADSLFELKTWKDIKELSKLTSFIVTGRPDSNKKDIPQEIKLLNKLYNTDIRYIDGPQVEISSTIIRDRASNDLSIKYLVPEAVESYINDNKLYFGGNIGDLG